MPAKNHLSLEQKQILLKALKESENPYIRERILILLLMNEGKTYQEISNFLEIAYSTVAYWAVHGDPDNLQSLKDEEPLKYGYEFGKWTAARLATHLEKETGIKLSGSQVSRILQKKSTFTFGQNIA